MWVRVGRWKTEVRRFFACAELEEFNLTRAKRTDEVKKNPDLHRDFSYCISKYYFSATISYGNSITTSLCNLTVAAYLPVRFTTPLVINFLSIG